MILVDTGAWFARFVETDKNYPAANRWYSTNKETLVTTDRIIEETLTLMRSRGNNLKAIEFGQAILVNGELARIHHLSDTEIMAAWDIFSGYSDKEWSFIDCTSYVLTHRLGIHQAFAFDHHFRQFGHVTIVP